MERKVQRQLEGLSSDITSYWLWMNEKIKTNVINSNAIYCFRLETDTHTHTHMFKIVA